VRHLGLWSILCLLLCLPAKAEIYSRHLPAASRVEASVSHTAGWDVSVTFDAETCEVFCEYRRKDGGLHLFPAPVTELRVYTDGASRPLLVIVDPAGTRQRVLLSRAASSFDLSCVEGKSRVAGTRFEGCVTAVVPIPSPPAEQPVSANAPSIGLPLRI
jgi:hypothetical protein